MVIDSHKVAQPFGIEKLHNGERDVDSRRKGKASRTISSSSSSDDGDNRGSKRGGGTSGGNRGVGGTSEGTGGDGSTGGVMFSQIDPGMSWAQKVKITMPHQDTDHGYRPGIWEQRKHLERLTTFPSDDDYSSGHDYHRSNHHRIDEHLQNLEGYSNTGTRASDSYGYDQSSSSSSIAYRGFGYYQLVLIPNSLRNHIFLIMGHQANHLTHHIRVMNNSFNHILTTGIVTPFVCSL
ncbi:hypothetical protein CK203_059501 [Vitis vinifera]|uniref:Uncharacterized protein n=1 Tax=Vitis vinifera TaxID=29760 RepID=A0A438GJ70_VITVI|nr:hypothetical protein CK203_059501 [Vitis vinifera]